VRKNKNIKSIISWSFLERKNLGINNNNINLLI